ncbi:hypothetical protein [Coxiella-like endosymbiont]|uniref:hypothetical protein n=1 Tax=Coxiella-like endosymbiont TaxID=1592897 RepID=UPI00272BCC34|nr:hypothetical protein [Coxiella-like endosymbiont]
MKNLGKYLLADNIHAAMAALASSLLAFLLPIGFVVTLILGLVTLQKGYKAGLAVLAFVLLPAIALVVTRHFGFFYQFDLLLIQCGLVFIFALILCRTASWQWVLEAAAIIGILAVFVVHLIFPNIRQIWIGLIHNYLQANGWALTFHLSADCSAEFAQHLSAIATGGFAFFVLFGMIVLLILARCWQMALFSPGRLQFEFARIRISQAGAGLLIIASIGLMWEPSWLVDIYPVLLFPFMIGGLSIFHRLVMNRREMALLIIIVYIALLLLTFFTVIALAIVGLIDSFYNFRKHYALLQN